MINHSSDIDEFRLPVQAKEEILEMDSLADLTSPRMRFEGKGHPSWPKDPEYWDPDNLFDRLSSPLLGYPLN